MRKRGSEQTVAALVKRTKNAPGDSSYVLRRGDEVIGRWPLKLAQSTPTDWAGEVMQAASDDADALGAMVTYSLVCEDASERALATLPLRMDGGGATEQADSHGQLAQLMRHLEAQSRLNMLLTDRIVQLAEKNAREQRELVKVALDRVTTLEHERRDLLEQEREAMAAALAAEHQDVEGEREAKVADKVVSLVTMAVAKAQAEKAAADAAKRNA